MSEFLLRLKERKLVQSALVYAAAAFALLQGLDIVGQRFGWPDAAERALIVALAIGFFVTVVLAWYHGERGAQRVSGAELLILALLLLIGGAALWKIAPGPAKPSADVRVDTAAARDGAEAAAIARKSIAVLPFTDLSPGHDQEYFSDGMAEELLNALAKIKDLKVAGRTSSFHFKGKNDNLREIGQALRLDDPVKALDVIIAGPTDSVARIFNTLWSQTGRAARRLPEFPEFARKMGLADLWDKYGEPDLCHRVALRDYACD